MRVEGGFVMPAPKKLLTKQPHQHEKKSSEEWVQVSRKNKGKEVVLGDKDKVESSKRREIGSTLIIWEGGNRVKSEKATVPESVGKEVVVVTENEKFDSSQGIRGNPDKGDPVKAAAVEVEAVSHQEELATVVDDVEKRVEKDQILEEEEGHMLEAVGLGECVNIKPSSDVTKLISFEEGNDFNVGSKIVVEGVVSDGEHVDIDVITVDI
ncbi:unnamed protein product [Cuscuta europaea]|uniref:Uncharacterized protein n=1 Tax=Cuscuta europaea TaxID=41803 RepID=A0A9P0ZUG0_CUSEU|nr:unnamed protein product [Cuscuta europaea]